MKPTGPRDPLTGLPLKVLKEVERGLGESRKGQTVYLGSFAQYAEDIPPETIREINEGAIKLLRETVDFLEGRSRKTGDELVDEIRAHLLLQ